jgi:hypothetical protein
LCEMKGTIGTLESPTHSWDDCAWALKGLNQLAILRSKGENYEYCGPARSSECLLADPEGEYKRQNFDSDDIFFAGREIQQVTLV